ncbi:MAG TPA: hypothetical protein VGH03_11505 [Caulobacteraceae bacterium]
MKPAPALRAAPQSQASETIGRRTRAEPAIIALAGLLLATAAGKLAFAVSHPLGFDELWTAMIASQRSFAGFVRQCYLDVNAPLAYLVAWIWAHIAGLSDNALRIPGVVFASAAPLLALTPSRSIPRHARLIWAALLACWIPGFVFAAEARSYALIIFISTGNTVAYLALLEKPSLKSAFAWTAASSLLILTHYIALPLVACQGLGYLLVHRQRAVRTWPALLAFAPALASLAAHAALLIGFTDRSAAGAAPLKASALPELIAFVVGGPSSALILLAWAGVSFALWRLRARADASPSQLAGSLAWIAPATSLATAALCLTASLAHPLIIDRYLTPEVPGVLLGIALLALEFGRRWRLAPTVLVALQFGLSVALLAGALRTQQRFPLEQASSDLMDAGIQRLAFFWDSPSSRGADPEASGEVGGFFFHRAGRPIRVDNLDLKPGEDPNLAFASWGRQPGSAILWLYDDHVAGAAARRFPPRIAREDPAWRCRDYGGGTMHILACLR